MDEKALLITLEDAKDYLGESGNHNDALIEGMILSAQEELKRATGIDFRRVKSNETAKRAVRMTVWLSFYADRDEVKNSAHIVTARDRLIRQLQYGGDVEDAGA